MNEFDEAIEAGKPIVSKLATAFADQTVLLHGVASFGQQLGNRQELYSCLHLLMNRFGEGRVVTVKARSHRVVRGMSFLMFLLEFQ